MRADLIKNVKLEFDWDSYVQEQYSIKWTPSDEMRICCPMCGDDKYKLYVNPKKKLFNCFKCNFKLGNYDVFDFVAITEHITRHQALVRLIREYASVTPEDDEFEAAIHAGLDEAMEAANTRLGDIKTIKALPVGLKPLLEDNPETHKFWTYLTNRGLTPNEIRAIQVHYTPESSLGIHDDKGKRRGDIANRVIWPIYGATNQLVSWQARDISGDGSLKYLMAPETEPHRTLWPYVRPYGKHAVVVEGVLDCLAVRRIPETSAYASFSKKISLDQILRLKTWGVEEVTLFWDKRDAKPEMVKALSELHMHFSKVYVCRMIGWLPEQDAGNMLADPQGTDKLKEALQDRVDTYDSLELAKWRIAP